MNKFILLIVTGLFVAIVAKPVVAQVNIDSNDLVLAGKYYQDGDFEKAADLYLKVFKISEQPGYFNLFLNCMVELRDFDRAEKEVKKLLKGASGQRKAEFYVQLGYVLKQQNREQEAVASFDAALKNVDRNKYAYSSLANSFLSRSEYEYAERVFVQAQKELPDDDFHSELGRIYMYQRNYDRMLDEYLLELSLDERKLTTIQNGIVSALSLDVDGSLNDLFRKKLLSQIQKEPQKLVFNRLLIWFFIQEKKFKNALQQEIALDKRTNAEIPSILDLADVAGRNKEYDDALKAYDYILQKGNQTENYEQVLKDRMNLSYLRFIDVGQSNIAEAEEINQQFDECLSTLGFTSLTYQLLINHAHLLAFYLGKTDAALQLLDKGVEIKGLNLYQLSEIKMEKADIEVYGADEWDAVLLYSQVIEKNKTNPLGDEAKLKKARLSYFLGDFAWAQAQLDIIKASTEKMTSNDAFELSALIGNNINLDTTDVPMKMFARADFYLFRNQDSLAMTVFDSIETQYPLHSLHDDVLYRKAMIYKKEGNYELAAENLKSIIDNDPYSLLADDALFYLAELYQFYLDRGKEAQELYRKIMVDYSGSVYVAESRNRYRALRGDTTDQKMEFLDDPRNMELWFSK